MTDAVRAAAPLVHCITNVIAASLSANALLAVGASPAMIDTPEEAGDFAAAADAVLVNLGSPTAARYAAIGAAVRSGTPWVLDPVGAGPLGHRTQVARDLLAHSPSIIRGNASEIIALADAGSGARGIDTAHTVADALPAALTLAERTGGVVAVSGPRDLIVSAGRRTWLTSGDPLLPLLSGSGCTLGALCAAYLGAGVGKHEAALAAHARAGAAAQLAARTVAGPGSFAAAWIDALHHLTSVEIADLVTWRDES